MTDKKVMTVEKEQPAERRPWTEEDWLYVDFVRLYESTDRDLPIDEWKMVAEINAQTETDLKWNIADRPPITHYYCVRYVMFGGELTESSNPTAVIPQGKAPAIIIGKVQSRDDPREISEAMN